MIFIDFIWFMSVYVNVHWGLLWAMGFEILKMDRMDNGMEDDEMEDDDMVGDDMADDDMVGDNILSVKY